MKYFKILFFLGYTLAFGQVGIGTNNPDPNTALDVAGKVKVRDLAKKASATTNADSLVVTDDYGNLKRSSLLKILQQAIQNAPVEKLVWAEGRNGIIWNNNIGWKSGFQNHFYNTELDIKTNVGNCLDEGCRFKAPSAGVYRIFYTVSLNHDGGVFDGKYGIFIVILALNPEIRSADGATTYQKNVNVYSGLQSPKTTHDPSLNDNREYIFINKNIFLKKGDEITPHFMTRRTANMGNASNTSVKLEKFSIYKIL